MNPELAASRRFCRSLARRTGRNFYYSFYGLPSEQSDAMCVLYSYMRICDDLGDDESVSFDDRLHLLGIWECLTRAAVSGELPDNIGNLTDRISSDVCLTNGLQVLPAMADVTRRFSIPIEYLVDVILGVRQDVEFGIRQHSNTGNNTVLTPQFAAFSELQDYCYLVAGVVGRCCIHIWGYRDDRALDVSIDCGLAFQLTNILRDIAEDCAAGRIYLPADELDRCGYTATDIQSQRRNVAFQELMEFQVSRAESYYQSAGQLFDLIEPVGRPVLWAMMEIYGGLLREIRRRQFDVYSNRVSLPRWQKFWIAGRALARSRIYGR